MSKTKEIKAISSDLIFKAAKTMIWKYGIKKVSVEEISAEAGVSKMTFYRMYKNKDAVAAEVLNAFFEEEILKYRKIMDSNQDFPGKIKQLIALKYENISDASAELIAEIIQHNNTFLQNLIEEQQQKFLKIFINDLKQAQKAGWIRKDLKPDFIIYILNSLNQKLIDESFLAMYKNTNDAIMELTNFFFYGISNNK